MTQKNLTRILVVDDERPIRRFLRIALSGQYTIYEAENGAQALEQAAIYQPDLIVLDLSLPDMDGMEVIRRLREWNSIPIIIVSVRDHEQQKVEALDAGADDYLTKPFSTPELMARIRAAIRHCAPSQDSPIFHNGDLIIDFTRRDVRVNDIPIYLTPTEYNILHLLVTHVGKVITQQKLINDVWSGRTDIDPHLLRANISNLRKKIEQDPMRPRYIVTELGVGYCLKEQEEKK